VLDVTTEQLVACQKELSAARAEDDLGSMLRMAAREAALLEEKAVLTRAWLKVGRQGCSAWLAAALAATLAAALPVCGLLG
jgi:hypothetical protein